MNKDKQNGNIIVLWEISEDNVEDAEASSEFYL